MKLQFLPKFGFRTVPPDEDLGHGDDERGSVTVANRKTYSGRPLCLLMSGIIVVTCLAWMLGSVMAGRRQSASFPFDSCYPPPEKRIQLVNVSETSVQCEAVPQNMRFDCFPGRNPNQQSCQDRGCCWNPLSHSKLGVVHHKVPSCYYPAGYASHRLESVEEHEFGTSVTYRRILASGYPDDWDIVRMDMVHKQNNMISVQIYPDKMGLDQNPYLKNSDHIRDGYQDVTGHDVEIEISSTNFGFRMKRMSTGQIL